MTPREIASSAGLHARMRTGSLYLLKILRVVVYSLSTCEAHIRLCWDVSVHRSR